MPTKAISFLGTGNYQETVYVNATTEQSCATRFFQEAIVEFHSPETLYVLLTPKAELVNWEALKAQLDGKVELVPIRGIPEGRQADDMWALFQKMTDCLSAGDHVLFDITHGFRSLPVLALLAASYLRVARGVTIEGLIYGAFEARNENNETPVFDLMPLVQLLEWTTATDTFIKTGDAQALASRLKEAHQLTWRQGATQDRSQLPRHLKGMGDALGALSQALALTRPSEVADQARKLTEKLESGAEELKRWAPPFHLLLEQITTAYEPFMDNTLESQRRLVRWYIEHAQYLPAIALAREWLVSWAGQALNKPDFEDRECVERALNQASQHSQNKPTEDTELMKRLLEIDHYSTLRDAWDTLGDLRNDTMHCGMRKEPRSASSIFKSANRLPDLLARLPLSPESGSGG